MDYSVVLNSCFTRNVITLPKGFVYVPFSMKHFVYFLSISRDINILVGYDLRISCVCREVDSNVSFINRSRVDNVIWPV